MTGEAATQDIDIVRLIDEAPISALQIRVILLCSLATFLDGYDVQALGLAVPHMAEAFRVAPTAFAPALSGSLVGMALGAMGLSPLADRFGRRRMLIAMLLLVGFTTFGAMMAHGPVDLAIWRVITGLGLGATVPIAIAATSEYAPARRRVALVTLMVVCTALGSFAGGIVAPIVEAHFGWRGIFGLGAVLPVAAAALLWLAFPESLRMLVARDPDGAEVRRQIARIAPALAGVRPSIERPRIVYRASVASLFAPAFRLRTILLWTIFPLNLFANYGLISWLPTLLHAAGWEHAAAQRATGLLALGGIVGGLLLAWLADKGRGVPALVIAYVATAVALAPFALGPGGALWLALLALVGMGAFGCQMALGSLSAAFYPPEVRSTGLGWSVGFGRIGSIFGPLALAGLMNLNIAPGAIIGLLMVPMLLCAVCVCFLPRALR